MISSFLNSNDSSIQNSSLSPFKELKLFKSVSHNTNNRTSQKQMSPSKSEFTKFEVKKSRNQNFISSYEFSFFLEEKEKSSSFVNSKKIDKAVQTSFLSEDFAIRGGWMRWLICFCDSLINISKYYCMDTPQALQTYFSKGELNLSSTEYNLFYSIFAYCFIIMFFSGYFTEKYGVRLTLFLFCLLCFIGHFFFTIGGSLEDYPTMLIGRFFFGIGSFCLDLCQDILITQWFFDKELALALGMRFATCRVGSALTILITPIIMIEGNYFQALLVGLLLSLLGIISSLIIVYIDRNFEEEKENGLTLEKLKDMGKFFWMMVANAMFAYTCYFGFVNNSNDILCTLYGYTPQQAGQLLTIMYFSACFTPIFCIVIDRMGNRINIMLVLLSFLMFPFVSFLIPEFSEGYILLSLVFIGIFFSSYAAVVWSSFPLLVEGKKQCMAFAIIYSTLNISLILASISVGLSIDILGEHDYKWTIIIMISCLILCFYSLMSIKIKGEKIVNALNSFTTNSEIRDIINIDPNIGQRLLDMIEDVDKDNFPPNVEMKTYK